MAGWIWDLIAKLRGSRPTPPPPAPPPPPPSVAPGNPDVRAVYGRFNLERAGVGRPPLVVSPPLERLASSWALKMASQGFAEHGAWGDRIVHALPGVMGEAEDIA